MPGALPGSGLIAYRMLGRGVGGAAAGKTQMMAAVQPGIEPGTSHAMIGAVIGAVPLPALVKSPEPHIVASGAPGEPIIPKHGISYPTETPDDKSLKPIEKRP